MPFKAGFVNIIGHPNVGKSTLMNALVGERLSIITSKAQTTRQRILGVVTANDHQIIFSDTPGIIQDPAYKMHEYMNRYIEQALDDADIILLMVEAGQKTMDEKTKNYLQSSSTPLLLLINKIDISDQKTIEDQFNIFNELLPGAMIIPVSALMKINLSTVMQEIIQLLPDHPPYYDPETLTTHNERFFVAEIIREKLFEQFRKEIPYSSEVAVDSYKETKQLTRIQALIFVERESQKAILLGHQGVAIKKLGIESRKAIEAFLDTRVHLELVVKVNKNWREDEQWLERFGYNQ